VQKSWKRIKQNEKERRGEEGKEEKRREKGVLINQLICDPATTVMQEAQGSDHRAEHTAEHAFIGSLQKLLGQTLQVRKVEHNRSGNTAFIVLPQLDPDIVARAESDVNSLISEGRAIVEHSFQSMADAKQKFPNLRANEERITGQVRVIEIKGHDAAACAMQHANNLAECVFFLVTRISKSGSEYEVDFLTGDCAKQAAIDLSVKLLNVCREIGANVNTAENTARKLKAENESNFRKLKALTRERLEAIKAETVGADQNGNPLFQVYKGVFTNLADDTIREFTGEKIQNAGAVVILANLDDSTGRTSIVFARNEKSRGFDCASLLRGLGPMVKGGGKPNFVTGTAERQYAQQIVDVLSDAVSKTKTRLP